jgi:hypothetical protein
MQNRRKCSYCGGNGSQCRCPSQVVEGERLMAMSQRRGRLMQPLLPEEVTPQEREMLVFEYKFKERLASRSE